MLLFTAYLLWKRHGLAPITGWVAEGTLILIHDNPYIFEGTEVDKGDVTKAMRIAMYRVLAVSFCLMVVWLPDKEAKEEGKAKED